MKRLKAIDIFRGLCMTWMVLNHLIDWWLISEFSWLHGITIMILDPIGASGFLFISGVSITLSYRRRLIKANATEDLSTQIVKNSYFFRALFIFIIAIFYNIPISVVLINPSYIWTWFVLLTAAVSMFMVWPFLYTSKMLRIITGIFIIIANQILMIILIPYKGEMNILGVLYHFLYHDISQDPILGFFPFFLFGTVIGDILFDSYINNDSNNKKQDLKKKLIIPLIIIGGFLIILGISINFPKFLIRQSLSWMIYAIGINISFMSILLLFEKFVVGKTKRSYRLLFYYSYYSLTVYLGHNLLYFIFLKRLNAFNVWFFILTTFFLIGLLLRFIYKKLGAKASIKIQIGRLSLAIALRIEERKKLKNRE
ncbi:MAG: heparan-alpha-glucosaminide N-acetyltransferase domain-containing protein [Candidatus Thorarchaeota archaeon]